MPDILVICGATASGKTSLAVDCAKKLNTEIISADSMLIYKGLDIGTAKPTEEEKSGIKHHLIDVAPPTDNFSVSDYEKLALPVVERLISKGKTPIVCGGTGFYINAILYKSGFGGSGADEKVRLYYENLSKERGKEYVYAILREKDPESAEKLHWNDVKRVIRALEIFDVTGKKKSEQADKPIPRFSFKAFSVDFPREELYDRINRRVDIMFEQGLKDEVLDLMKNGITREYQCMQGIGYKEVAEGIENGWSDEEIKEMIKKNTRNYAKRQITFFKRTQNYTLLHPNQATAEEVLKIFKN
ncbi:MAG: tRNA (adenosine(37)-N6)-dimethylallyltransferase MiaA [Clostridia bacterium]|nr:tRNA (adenosine(37)-N6)-dimethylallyltransferase MiaA [Clostridia bacterium]